MAHRRTAGLLLHPTSLPGPHGSGDLGPDAHRFLDVLADAGCAVWQMLPLGPTGYGDSPYQSFSSFAGNPLLIHLPGCATATGPAQRVDYQATIAARQAALANAVAHFVPGPEYERFLVDSERWLPDYALFMALKALHGGSAWTTWDTGADRRVLAMDPDAVVPLVHARQVEQFLFDQQFRALRAAAHDRGIQLMGDVPIYVAHDSADVWANRPLFRLDERGGLQVQAGVPPDYFSPAGQLWGNPLYAWQEHEAQGYQWWIARLRHAFTRFDIVRLDHFRGFESYWEVAGDATTAVDGRWQPGPGAALFDAVREALGPVRIVAENLGEITPAVEALRTQLQLPGMVVLQFAFGDDDPDNVHRPHNWTHDLVAYTGTHDNDTTRGWQAATATAGDAQETDAAADAAVPPPASPVDRACAYLDTDGTELHWDFIRAVHGSVADTAIVPLQDLLGLGSDARMNFPGRTSGNWQWRFTWDEVT
ncbi:MAG: 4-alpha-glucanotransferase, partial [Gemmatimonadetes bacterium]|nr:4-alpha-glucanotransferase [Gemmatimonadota bacterium]